MGKLTSRKEFFNKFENYIMYIPMSRDVLVTFVIWKLVVHSYRFDRYLMVLEAGELRQGGNTQEYYLL